MKCLKFISLVLLFLALPFTAIFATPTSQTTQTEIYLFDTTKLDCVQYDTIRLVAKGHRNKGKRYFYTDKECTVVELKIKNKKPYPLEWVVILVRKIFFKS